MSCPSLPLVFVEREGIPVALAMVGCMKGRPGAEPGKAVFGEVVREESILGHIIRAICAPEAGAQAIFAELMNK